MLAPDCPASTSDDEEFVVADEPSQSTAADRGLRPVTRGNFRGFLPPATVAALRASAATGNGLALLETAPAAPASVHAGNGAALLLAVAALAYLAGRGSR